jgi:hypothetical protein
MGPASVVSAAAALKTRANEAFHVKDYSDAVALYTQVRTELRV